MEMVGEKERLMRGIGCWAWDDFVLDGMRPLGRPSFGYRKD